MLKKMGKNSSFFLQIHIYNTLTTYLRYLTMKQWRGWPISQCIVFTKAELYTSVAVSLFARRRSTRPKNRPSSVSERGKIFKSTFTERVKNSGWLVPTVFHQKLEPFFFRCLLHQHFTRAFFADILAPKITKLKRLAL